MVITPRALSMPPPDAVPTFYLPVSIARRPPADSIQRRQARKTPHAKTAMAYSFAQEYPVALITGAASGIGRELARQLAAQGVAVAAVDRAEEGLRSLEEEVLGKGGNIAWAAADVTDAPALQARIAELETALGPI